MILFTKPLLFPGLYRQQQKTVCRNGRRTFLFPSECLCYGNQIRLSSGIVIFLHQNPVIFKTWTPMYSCGKPFRLPRYSFCPPMTIKYSIFSIVYYSKNLPKCKRLFPNLFSKQGFFFFTQNPVYIEIRTLVEPGGIKLH